MLNEIYPRAAEQFILPRLISGGRYPAQSPKFLRLSAESERRRNPQPVGTVPAFAAPLTGSNSDSRSATLPNGASAAYRAVT